MTPFEDSTTESRDVPFDELLSYAKRISRFTLPATYRPAPPKQEETIKPSIETSEDELLPNGSGTSLPAANIDPASEEQQAQQGEETSQGVGYAALSPAQKEWLDHMAKAPFIPWPNEDDMKRGGLVAVQVMLEKGQDPSAVLGPKEQEDFDRRQREESEKRKLEKEEKEKERRAGGKAGPGGRGLKKEEASVEGFGLYNPDEDDGDE